ncbi:collagen alpha-1(XII) chain [Patella vulgata]|uniref:collagen alpha-1(XII) chain n=1 Tax=Patella vulgata TaxID=6465 RepID=UPI00217F90AB|nr:collagen alpha-1(XII) chain [Patella vulgata]
MNPKLHRLVTFGLAICLVQSNAVPKTILANGNDCPDDRLMKSRTCKSSMENLRNQYRDTLSNLQDVLAKTIDEVDKAASRQLEPLCSKLSLQTPLIRAEDVQKCVLSQWSEWSKPQGFGKIKRTREIKINGCGCPDESELVQTVDVSKYTNDNTSVADQFQGEFLTNGSNPNLPRDILIVLDSSGSIYDKDFELMKDGLEIMIDLFCGGFGPDKSNNRMAIIQFATNVTIIHEFGDDQDPETLKEKVRKLRHYAGNTCTGDAMDVASRDIFNSVNGMRDYTVKDTLLVTDGQSNCGVDLHYTVSTFLQKKSKVWALGVGLATSPAAKKEVESVVTDRNAKHIFSLAQFTDFKAMIDNIKARGTSDPCQKIEL